MVKYLKLQNYKAQTILNAPVVNGYCLIRKLEIASSRYGCFVFLLFCFTLCLFEIFCYETLFSLIGKLTATIDITG